MEKNNSHPKPGCLACGAKLLGRVDKKYCSDYCRSAHFNKVYANQNNFMRHINLLLKKNRVILQDFVNRRKSKVHRHDLLVHGFTFEYFTSEVRTRSGKLFRFCYEFGYHLVDEEATLITKKDF